MEQSKIGKGALYIISDEGMLANSAKEDQVTYELSNFADDEIHTDIGYNQKVSKE